MFPMKTSRVLIPLLSPYQILKRKKKKKRVPISLIGKNSYSQISDLNLNLTYTKQIGVFFINLYSPPPPPLPKVSIIKKIRLINSSLKLVHIKFGTMEKDKEVSFIQFC